jgi:hypothetical protein
MPQHSLTTRLDHYINTRLPETHGHQRKAFRDFVAALLVVRTCCQATLARSLPNFEAASRRLTRWLHNPRLEPQAQARAHAPAVVAQLPLAGPVRIALDWTTEDQQQLLVASLLIGRRAIPLYWQGYTRAELKGAQRAREHAFVDELFEQRRRGLPRDRLLLTAERGFCAGQWLARLEAWGGPFVFRLPAQVTVYQDQQWRKLGSLTMGGHAAAGLGPSLGQAHAAPALLGDPGTGPQQEGALGVLALGQQSPPHRVHPGARIRSALWL